MNELVFNNGAADTVKFGRHSLIPDCCIAFYLNLIRGGLNYRDVYFNFERRERVAQLGYRYVPCDDCLRNERVVNTHRCKMGASKECTELLIALNGGVMIESIGVETVVSCQRCGKPQKARVVKEKREIDFRWNNEVVIDHGQERLTCMCDECRSAILYETDRGEDKTADFWIRVGKARELVELCDDDVDMAIEFIRCLPAL